MSDISQLRRPPSVEPVDIDDINDAVGEYNSLVSRIADDVSDLNSVADHIHFLGDQWRDAHPGCHLPIDDIRYADPPEEVDLIDEDEVEEREDEDED
jgi:hypothetical protein